MSTSSRHSIAILLLTGAALAIAACSDGPSPSTSTSSTPDLSAISACDLLTPDEIETATGLAASAGEDISQLGGRLPMCSWRPAGGGFRPVANVMVTTSSYTDFDQYVEMSTDNAFGVDIGEFERVDGVGRFGVWLTELKMLQVFTDDHMVQIGIEVADDRDAAEAAKSLAGTVIERLQ